MCGLVGLMTKWNTGMFSKDSDIFKNMLYMDTLRGDDATGVCMVTNEAGASVIKKGVEYPDFRYEPKFTSLMQSCISSGKALLGHNRKATVGGHKDECAHPFVYDDRYVFFHNGTLTNHKALGDTEVDSDALGRLVVDCQGDLDKLGEVFAKAKGAWACVWYDAEKHTVYLTRNKERPLSLLKLKSGNILYASEAWMAQASAQRNTEEVLEVIKVQEDKLYSIDLGVANTLDIVVQDIPKKALALPSTPRGSKAVKNTGVTKVATTLSRKEARDVRAELEQQHWIGFFVSEALCQDASVDKTEDANPLRRYDWILFGINPTYPGVLYSAVIKDMYLNEINTMVEQKEFVHGCYTDFEYGSGKLEVWLDEVWEGKGQLC